MPTLLEISRWEQLVRAKSTYENLRIYVENVSSDLLTGTKISIVDYNTNFVYFCGFVDILGSTIIPDSGKLSDDAMLDIINSFGFNVRYAQPEVLTQDVISVLEGLDSLGYQYVYRYYDLRYPKEVARKDAKYLVYASEYIDAPYEGLVISESPKFIKDDWEWCASLTAYAIDLLLENGTVCNGVPIQ